MANGIYSNSELVDSLINDLNNVLKEQMCGQYVKSCMVITQMAQKLVNLRTTIDNELKGKDQTIEQLKENLARVGVKTMDVSPNVLNDITKKDGAE